MTIDKRELSARIKALKSTCAHGENSIKGILIDGQNMTANNLLVSATIKLPEECAAQERFIIPESAFGFIEKLPDGAVKITQSGGRISIESGAVKGKFSAPPPDQFPASEFDLGSEAIKTTVETASLLQGVGAVMHAMSNSAEVRPAMRGVLLEGDGEFLNLVAIDGFRLSRFRFPFAQQIKCILSIDAVNRLHAFGFSGDSLSIAETERRVCIGDDERALCFGTLDTSKFMNWRMVYSPDSSVKTSFARKELLSAAERANSITDSKIKSPLALTLQGSEMIISCSTACGEFSETLPLQTPVESELCIGFNPQYLIDALKSLQHEEIHASFASPTHPALFSTGQQDEIVLPVRLKAE
jgi:DNA polymerase-3 subunit beta